MCDPPPPSPATPKARHLVESFHFTPEVEALLRGKSGSLNQDIAYTLRHFPNHHRALVAVMRLGDRYKAERIPDVPYSIDCYFRRATQLAPDDSIARMLYASYLFRKDRTVEANLQVDRAMELAAENGLTHYNIGLVLLEHRQLERALQQAHRALALGYPRTDLKERLITSGRWRDPEPPAAAASRPEAKQD